MGAGIAPIGLGARDTLRLEAGLNLYGQDMDEDNSPLASNLAWTIAWEPAGRDFIGRAALEAQRAAGEQPKLVGLVLEERGVLRAHQVVRVEGVGEGEITSGSFRPPSASPSPWPACRRGPAIAPKWKSVASGTRFVSSSRTLFAMAKP